MAIRFHTNICSVGGKPKTFPFSQTFASGTHRTFTVKVNENAKKERTALDNIRFIYSGTTLGISTIDVGAQIYSVVNGIVTVVVLMNYGTDNMPISITGEVKTF